MAVKTITINLEAYEILAAEKKGGESFSQVIKRRLKRNSTASNLLKNLSECTLSEYTLSSIDGLISDRKKSMAASPLLDKEG
ncbi:hypothetical protein ES703_118328 [subsurface metagenome]